ncbi:hypothetical protein [Cellulomonas sp. ICMP 17802]|uniref:hypothetical protein n=1 Tax=Cellulomonas sp. ICMP 17802 TaxID=3239199 RepID=UPI00351B11FB
MTGTVLGRAERPWLAAWFGIAGLAVANGAFRERLLVPRLGTQRAHQVSTGLLLLGIWGTAAALARVRPLPDGRSAARVGAAWAGSTLALETGLGLARRVPPAELVADYDLRAGRLWALVPVSMAVAPVVCASRP